MITIRSHTPFQYQSIDDSAVDGAEWVKKYLRTLNVDDIKKKPGGEPVTFTLKRLSRAQALRCDVRGGVDLSARQQSEVVALGLKGVTGLPGFTLQTSGIGDNERVSEECLDQLFAVELFNELSTIIVKASGLSPLE